jgi:hypothetical protein
MRISTLYFSAAALLAPLAVSAAPLQRSIDSSSLEVLREFSLCALRSTRGTFDERCCFSLYKEFAFVLENFETQFYQQGLSQFQASDYASAGFSGSSSEVVIEEITIIESDESEHVTVIEVCIRFIFSAFFFFFFPAL